MSEETTREARGEGVGLGRDVPPGTAGAGAQAELRDADLQPFGWAPGWYSGQCTACGCRHEMADKRSHRCRPCAVKRFMAPKARPAPAASAVPQSLPPSPTLEAAREAVAKYLCESFLPDDSWKGPWSTKDENAKDQWRWYADRILSLLSPGREGQGTGMGMEPSAPAGLRDAKRVSEPVEPTYACADCGLLRTKAQGGTTFTVCEDCWEKHRIAAKGTPSVTPAPSNGEEA